MKIVLRTATMADAEMLLTWRNDPTTRAMSHNTAEVAPAEHVAWLAKTLANPTRQLYIAECNGRPVGTVRADADNGVTELSWTVAPQARGNGIGKAMVVLVASQITGPIRAEIKIGNRASEKIAEAARMRLQRTENGLCHYHRG